MRHLISSNFWGANKFVNVHNQKAKSAYLILANTSKANQINITIDIIQAKSRILDFEGRFLLLEAVPRLPNPLSPSVLLHQPLRAAVTLLSVLLPQLQKVEQLLWAQTLQPNLLRQSKIELSTQRLTYLNFVCLPNRIKLFCHGFKPLLIEVLSKRLLNFNFLCFFLDFHFRLSPGFFPFFKLLFGMLVHHPGVLVLSYELIEELQIMLQNTASLLHNFLTVFVENQSVIKHQHHVLVKLVGPFVKIEGKLVPNRI